MSVSVESHLKHKQRFLNLFAFVHRHVLNCRYSTLAPLLPPCISVLSFCRLPHSLFEAQRLHANKRRCVCMARPLIGQSWLSRLNRGSVGDEELPWSPNISIFPFSPGSTPAFCVGVWYTCLLHSTCLEDGYYVWEAHCTEKHKKAMWK